MKYVALILLISSVAANTNAQITMSKSDYIHFEAVQLNGITDTALNPKVLSSIIADSGPNRTWDFTKASFNVVKGGANSVFIPNSDTIFGSTDSIFLSATYAEESPASIDNGTNYPPSNEFYKITDSGAWDLGGCEDSDGTEVNILSLSPPIEIMPFPLRYQTSWQSTSKFIDAEASIYNPSEAHIEVADGYGTLILPNYSGNAIRVKDTFIVKDSVQGYVFADTGITYTFYTNDGYRASIGTLSGGSMIASYTAPSASIVNSPDGSELSLSFTQNPVVSGSPTLLFTLPSAGFVQIEIRDLLGRNVRVLENEFEAGGAHSIPIGPLSSGTYFARIQSDNMSAMQKLEVE